MITANRWRISSAKQFFDGWRQIYRFLPRMRPISMFLGDRVLTTTYHGRKIFLDPRDNDLTPMCFGVVAGNIRSNA